MPDHYKRQERRNPCLLIVEDDETDILFIQRCLNQYPENIPMVVARDGSEALEILRDPKRIARPYVIVTDLNMPGMSGHELIAEIRVDEKLRDSVVFVLSSSGLIGDIRQAYSANVAGYLNKQANLAEMKKSFAMIFDYCVLVDLPM